MSRLNGRLRSEEEQGTESAENRRYKKRKERDGKTTGDGGRNKKPEEREKDRKVKESWGKTVSRVRERATREE